MQILRRINHENVIKLHEFFADEGYVYIIMQYANKGDLHQVTPTSITDPQAKEDQKRKFFRSLDLGNGEAIAECFGISA